LTAVGGIVVIGPWTSPEHPSFLQFRAIK